MRVDDFWEVGIEPNQRFLEALFRYSHEQGLATLRPDMEELFHPDSLGLAE